MLFYNTGAGVSELLNIGLEDIWPALRTGGNKNVVIHGLNIYGYLKFLLEHRPGKDMTDEQLAELVPWSEKLQSIKNRM